MTRSLNILHISDFHFVGKGGGILSDDRINASLGQLATEINERASAQLLVATGDFIDGRADSAQRQSGWNRAEKALWILAEKLRVPASRIVLCPGNHDVLRADLFPKDGGFPGDGLSEYSQFVEKFERRPSETKISDFATGFGIDSEIGEDVLALELNMMFGARQVEVKWGDDQGDSKVITAPGVVSAENCDQFRTKIAEFWTKGLLIVACHFPITNFDWSQAFEDASEDESKVSLWALNHLASGWGNVLRVLVNMCDGKSRKLLFLHGDTHRQIPVHRIARGAFASTSGRLDERNQETQVPRHCRLLRLDMDQFDKSQYDDIMYVSENRSAKSSDVSGTWYLAGQYFPSSSESDSNDHSLTCAAERIDYPNQNVTEAKNDDDSEQDIDVGVEIRTRIREWNLFELRRVSSSEGEPSANTLERLGHIRLGPVLNDPEFFSNILRLFSDWIVHTRKTSLGDKETLIVGVDAWGASLGASLGMRLNLRSVGLTVRGLEHDDRLSIINTRPVGETIKEYRKFIIVTDVVVSGRTLSGVKSLIEDDVVKEPCEVIGVCVVAARTSSLFGSGSVDFPLGAVVTDIEIPVVPARWLPDVSVLPAESFGFGPARR